MSVPGPVSAKFVTSEEETVGLIGPMLGGRKTTAFLRIFALAYRFREQTIWRWLVVAPTVDYLERHVIPRWRDLIGDVGQWTSTGTRRVLVPLNGSDGQTFAQIELIFLGLDSREQRAKLGNYETTGVLIVDARHIAEDVFDEALEIVGTYPLTGHRPARGGLIAVSRPPHRSHWLVKRPEIELYRQPGGRSPNAENVDNLAKQGISYAALALRLHPEKVRVEIDAELGGDGAEAAAEAVRNAAREDFAQFIALVMPDIQPAEHHRLLIKKLEKVARDKIKRLMIFLPPGSAKSTYASILFPPWYMGRNPSHPVIAASHAKELAERFGRRVRNIVGSTVYKEIFGFGLSGDSGAAGRWETSRGGEYYAVGVDGSVTGRRAALGIIDDPVKGRAEADSPTVRAHAWEWYKSDFWTRLLPNAGLIYIGTRWHDDDLAGRLLEEAKAGGEEWHVVSIPAVAIEGRDDPLGRLPGERLWPEWFGEEVFAQAQRDLRNWSALYQQEPMPESGDYFKREWIRWYETAPPRERLRTYGASDYAVKANAGDYTVHLVFGIDPHDDMYLLDLWRNQTASNEWVESLIDLMGAWKTLTWAEEKGQIEKGVGPFITKRQLERKVYAVRRQFPSVMDKATRAQSFRGRMAMGKVYLPRRAPWIGDFVNELLRFPAGKNDDQIDCCSLIGQMLDELVRGSAPQPQAAEPETKPEFYVALDERAGGWLERVRIITPGVVAATVLVKNVGDRERARWPAQYRDFCEAVRRAAESGEPLPGVEEGPPPNRGLEPARQGVVLEAPRITFDLACETARHKPHDPYRKYYT
jgi:predicted phage terminase large subunit-like protein